MGDTVTLACAGYSEPYVEITWILNGASVYYSPLLTNTTEDVTDPIPIRQSFLQICAVNANVSGSYTCIVSNRVMSTEYTIQLTVACKCALYYFFRDLLVTRSGSRILKGVSFLLLWLAGHAQPHCFLGQRERGGFFCMSFENNKRTPYRSASSHVCEP